MINVNVLILLKNLSPLKKRDFFCINLCDFILILLKLLLYRLEFLLAFIKFNAYSYSDLGNVFRVLR